MSRRPVSCGTSNAALWPSGNSSSRNDALMARYPVYHDHADKDLRWVLQYILDQPKVAQKLHDAGSRDLFPVKLHAMIESCVTSSHSEVIHWLPHGRAFVLGDRERLVKEILPKHMPTMNNFASFQRQINMYGYLKLMGNHEDKGAYYHEFFLRGRPVLSKLIVRQTQQESSVRRKLDPRSEPNFDCMTPVLGTVSCAFGSREILDLLSRAVDPINTLPTRNDRVNPSVSPTGAIPRHDSAQLPTKDNKATTNAPTRTSAVHFLDSPSVLQFELDGHFSYSSACFPKLFDYQEKQQDVTLMAAFHQCQQVSQLEQGRFDRGQLKAPVALQHSNPTLRQWQLQRHPKTPQQPWNEPAVNMHSVEPTLSNRCEQEGCDLAVSSSVSFPLPTIHDDHLAARNVPQKHSPRTKPMTNLDTVGDPTLRHIGALCHRDTFATIGPSLYQDTSTSVPLPQENVHGTLIAGGKCEQVYDENNAEAHLLDLSFDCDSVMTEYDELIDDMIIESAIRQL